MTHMYSTQYLTEEMPRLVEDLEAGQLTDLAISTSGNSPNVIKAAEAAREQGLSVIGLTGKNGGALAGLCHAEIRVPWHGHADRIQEVHIKCIHALIDHIEAHCA